MRKINYPKISVVMLNYNGLKYLKKTIHPILKLDYPNYEFIIVDNGSTDGSVEFIKKFKRIRLIKSPRLREKNFACNYAIKRARGKYILLIDNDILIDNKKILTDLILQAKSLDQFGCLSLSIKDIGAGCSKYYGGYLGYYFIKEVAKLPIKKIKKLHNHKIGCPHGVGIFIKKKLWGLIGGYDSFLKFGGDDNDFGIKLWLMGYENKLYSKSIQIHLGLPERQDNKKYSLKWKEMFYAHLYTITKNYSFFNMLVTLFLYSIFGFLKSIKQSLFRFHYGPLLAFFQGYHLFLKNLSHAIKMRKIIQSKRIIKEDIFLRIKPLKFN